MNAAFIIIISTFLLVSCQRVDQEQQLFDCWNSSFKSKGIDIKNEGKRFEENLIENGYLVDSTWFSYKKLIDSLSTAKAPMILRTIPMEEFLSNAEFVITNCMDLKKYDKITKLSKLSDDFIKASKDKNLGLNYVYKQISSEINGKDFESDLYRTWISWILISNSINPNMLKSLLPKPNPSVNYSMTIKIDSQMNYYINGAKLDFDNIDLQIKNMANQSDSKILLQVDKSVAINKIIEIMNISKRHNISVDLKSVE